MPNGKLVFTVPTGWPNIRKTSDDVVKKLSEAGVASELRFAGINYYVGQLLNLKARFAGVGSPRAIGFPVPRPWPSIRNTWKVIAAKLDDPRIPLAKRLQAVDYLTCRLLVLGTKLGREGAIR